MKLRVQKIDGSIEVLTLVPPLEIRHGEMTVIYSAEGVEHFFSEQGYYDGWGTALADGTWDRTGFSEEILQRIEEIESSREIEGEGAT